MIVVDAGLVVHAVGDDTATGASARAVLRQYPDICAPDLIDPETVSVLRRRWLAGTLSDQRLHVAVQDLVALPIRRHPTRALMLRAVELRDNVTPYDACYVALAEALDAPLLTVDRRLARSSTPRCEIRVVELD